MKRILEIINKGSEPCLFTLSNETTYNLGDVFLQPDRVLWQRLQVQNKEIIEQNPEYRKVVAFNINATPVITLKAIDVTYLRNCLKDGFPFLEVECREDGYPELKNGHLIVHDRLTCLVPNITPAEALERIKQLNENFTNNHKLTPGLHESS